MTVAMTMVLAITKHNGARLAELAFLLILGSGLWMALPGFRTRTHIAGIGLAVAGALLIVATHWGHYG
jgi:hypothetical protein